MTLINSQENPQLMTSLPHVRKAYLTEHYMHTWTLPMELAEKFLTAARECLHRQVKPYTLIEKESGYFLSFEHNPSDEIIVACVADDQSNTGEITITAMVESWPHHLIRAIASNARTFTWTQ